MGDNERREDLPGQKLIWSEADDGHNPKANIPIVRPIAKNGYRAGGLILSPSVVGTYTHFQGRTKPCTAASGHCEICDAGVANRWIGYLAILHYQSKKINLLEITAGISKEIATYKQEMTTLRGSMIMLGRMNPRPQSKVLITSLKPYTALGDQRLPDPPDVSDTLMRIWRVAKPAPRRNPSIQLPDNCTIAEATEIGNALARGMQAPYNSEQPGDEVPTEPGC